jgi:hypothetical protein
MGQLEFKIIKMPPSWQEFYSNIARNFGWHVHSMQESVNRVVNRNLGFGTTFSFHSIPMTWSNQTRTGVYDIQSILSVTYARDWDMPNLNQVKPLENRCWELVDWWVPNCIKNGKYDYEMKEWKEVRKLQGEASSLLNRGSQQISAAAQSTTAQPSGQVASNQNQGGKPASGVKHDPSKKQAYVRISNTDHNFFQNNLKGILIYCTFSIENCLNDHCSSIAYFYKQSGEPLKDINSNYKDSAGNVSVGSEFSPAYDNTVYDYFTLFLPYDELDIREKGRHDLKFYVSLYNFGLKTSIGKSDWSSFWYSRD